MFIGFKEIRKTNLIQKIIIRLTIVVFFLLIVHAGRIAGQTVKQTFSDNGQLIQSNSENKNEEKLPDPLIDEDTKLIALSPDRSVFLAADCKSVVFLAEVCLREGPLEFFSCSKNSKAL